MAALFIGRSTIAPYLRLLAAPVLAGVLLASYNFYVFHRLSGGYAAWGAKRPVLPVIAGLFFSPGRGLLIYTPVVLFALCAFLPGAARLRMEGVRGQHKLLLVTATCALILEFLAISESTIVSPSVVWWGGYCWGPRMLTELVPPLIVLMAFGVPIIDRRWPRRVFALLAVYSFLIQAIGVFFYPKGHWDGVPEGIDAVHGRLWNWRDNPVARTLKGGLYWEPYVIIAAAITGGIPAAAERMHELNVNPYEESEPGKVPRADRGLP
jgi:hypothetical protein